MGLFPLARRMRSYMGPHMTCLITAETHNRRYSRRANSTFDFFLQRSLVFSHMRFLLYFTAGLVAMVMFFLVTLIFMATYLAYSFFLRFQYKLTVFLLMLGRRHFQFGDINCAIFYFIHLLMMLVGGFGWISLLFIEMWYIKYGLQSIYVVSYLLVILFLARLTYWQKFPCTQGSVYQCLKILICPRYQNFSSFKSQDGLCMVSKKTYLKSTCPPDSLYALISTVFAIYKHNKSFQCQILSWSGEIEQWNYYSVLK